MSRTQTFGYTGAVQSWTVPANIAGPVTVQVRGGSSASQGGLVAGSVTVAPGDVLYFFVGGGSTGNRAGGFNGGGTAGVARGGGAAGYGGAGASDIRKNAQALTNRVAVAGGAGGPGRGSSQTDAAGGSATGQAGFGGGGGVGGGGGGTQSAGGAAGASPYGGAGSAGALGTGGASGDTLLADGVNGRGGGGGGGGYYGGGAGGYNGGQGSGFSAAGGGGSNYVGGLTSSTSSRGTSNSSSNANGSITITYNVTPNAPTLTGPPDNATLDRTVTQRFSWTFSDDDPGDSQSKADVRFSIDGGTTWSTSTVNSPNGYLDVAGGTLASGSWQWQVRTYDSLGNVGPWSGSRFFTAAAPANGPTITYPTNGAAVQQNDHVDWSLAAAQQSYQVQRLADNSDGTAPDTSTVYFDTGEVTGDVGVTTRTVPLTFAVNGRYEWIRVRCRSGGLLTSWTAIRVQVSYTPPPAAAVTVTVDDVADTITVSWATPAPTGSQPTPTAAQVLRTVAPSETETGSTIPASGQLGTTGTWTFPTPVTGFGYAFAVRTFADNGQTTDSGWVT